MTRRLQVNAVRVSIKDTCHPIVGVYRAHADEIHTPKPLIAKMQNSVAIGWALRVIQDNDPIGFQMMRSDLEASYAILAIDNHHVECLASAFYRGGIGLFLTERHLDEPHIRIGHRANGFRPRAGMLDRNNGSCSTHPPQRRVTAAVFKHVDITGQPVDQERDGRIGIQGSGAPSLSTGSPRRRLNSQPCSTIAVWRTRSKALTQPNTQSGNVLRA